MVQAARSGKQNIAEGKEAGLVSMETEIKLMNVARASLDELLSDYAKVSCEPHRPYSSPKVLLIPGQASGQFWTECPGDISTSSGSRSVRQSSGFLRVFWGGSCIRKAPASCWEAVREWCRGELSHGARNGFHRGPWCRRAGDVQKAPAPGALSTMRPAYMTLMRSAYWRTTPRSCVMRMTEVPMSPAA